jgi:hypothetical protein
MKINRLSQKEESVVCLVVLALMAGIYLVWGSMGLVVMGLVCVFIWFSSTALQVLWWLFH